MLHPKKLQELENNFSNFMDCLKEDEKNRISVLVHSKKVVEETAIAPGFIHSEINNLYIYGSEIPFHLIDEIKALPRETLIKDLNAVIYDSIARFEVFYEEKDSAASTWFPVHALLLLRDIQAEPSLGVVLDFLSQDEEFLDYWTGDMLTEDIWSVIVVCGKNNLELLSSFLKETGRYTWARAIVAEAVNQMALHEVISEQQAVEWLGELIQYYLEHTHIENLIDSDFNGSLIGICLDLQAEELAPLIKQMLDSKIANKMIAGNWEAVQEELKLSSPVHAKKELESMEKIYGDIQNRIKQEELEDEYEDDFFDEDIELQAPYIRDKPKIGRNEPYYCGSGRKYKKCHGVNG